MNRLELQMMYKAETSESAEPCDYEFEIFRSKGQWVMSISDEEKFRLFGHESTIMIERPTDYVQWLEEKLMELLK